MLSDVEHGPARCSDEESADAPPLGGQRVHDLIAEALRVRVGVVDIIDFDGERGILLLRPSM